MKNLDLTKIIRKDILKMATYKPAPYLLDLEEKYKHSKNEIIKLDQGENPYGSPTVVRAALIRAKNIFNLYPDPEYKKLRLAISSYVGMNIKHIMVGSGSDELLDLVLRMVINEGDEIISCPPTYGMYPMLINLNKGKNVFIQRNTDYTLRIEEILSKITNKTKAILICSPNNPTGNVATEQEINILLNTGKLVIVDEAYFEFCNKTFISMCRKYNNLIILRTLSKWAGLAGLRLGYVIMSPLLINEIIKIKLPFNVNLSAEIGGIAAFNNIYSIQKTIKKIVSERERVYNSLNKLPFLNVYPSEANFLFIKINGSLSKMKNYLDKNLIFPRYYDEENSLRLTIGKPEQNDKIIICLKSFIK
ncbi:MAG: histidinol-phosphate transaminase [Minisyncoccales bacterium]|jgi:histidinol-phosphate aminotransferase